MKWLLGAALPILSFFSLISGLMLIADPHRFQPAWAIAVTSLPIALILFAGLNTVLCLTNLATTVESAERYLQKFSLSRRKFTGPRRLA